MSALAELEQQFMHVLDGWEENSSSPTAVSALQYALGAVRDAIARESRAPAQAVGMREALRAAKCHLITLGGDPRPSADEGSDEIQAAVLDVIDAALAAQPPADSVETDWNNGRYNGNGRHWETPPEIFEPLDEEFNFTLDPCCTAATAKCPEFFTEAENGLEKSWAGHRVFMNPPYGKEVYAWTKKARLEQANSVLTVGLLPASTDLAWWHDDVAGHAEVRFLTGGPYRASGFFASVIVVWRPRACIHDWREIESQAENAVKCRLCSTYGERQRDGSVYWPAT